MQNTGIYVRWFLGIAMLCAVMMFGLIGLVVNVTDAQRGEVHLSSVYIEECGACHLAYPPGLLPAQSWREIMLGLTDHFEDNAELDLETAAVISQYLEKHALCKGSTSTMSEMLRNIPDDPPIRITELPAFVAAHDDVSIPHDASNNKGVYLSRCGECHSDAEAGLFDD